MFLAYSVSACSCTNLSRFSDGFVGSFCRASGEGEVEGGGSRYDGHEAEDDDGHDPRVGKTNGHCCHEASQGLNQGTKANPGSLGGK